MSDYASSKKSGGTGGGAAIGSPVTGLMQGSVPFGGPGGNLAQDNANFFWDNTGKRLIIGNSAVSDLLRLDLANGVTNKYIDFTYVNGTGSYGSFVQTPYGMSWRADFNLSFFPATANGVFIGRESDNSDSTAPAKLNVFAGSAAQSGVIINLAASQTADALQLKNSGGTLLAAISAAGKVIFDRTITPAGTTGNQVINKPRGRVNMAAGTNAITVTNSLVTADSHIGVTVMSNDVTAQLKNVVASAGAFTINLVSNTTSETKISFVVFE